MTGAVFVQPIFPEHAPQPSSHLSMLTGSDHWKIERVVALIMLAIIPGSFVCDSVFMNYLLAASLAIHAHWGLSLIRFFYTMINMISILLIGMDAVLIDYCPRKALPLANIIRYGLTCIAFLGLW